MPTSSRPNSASAAASASTTGLKQTVRAGICRAMEHGGAMSPAAPTMPGSPSTTRSGSRFSRRSCASSCSTRTIRASWLGSIASIPDLRMPPTPRKWRRAMPACSVSPISTRGISSPLGHPAAEDSTSTMPGCGRHGRASTAWPSRRRRAFRRVGRAAARPFRHGCSARSRRSSRCCGRWRERLA